MLQLWVVLEVMPLTFFLVFANDGTKIPSRVEIGSYFIQHFSYIYNATNPCFDDALDRLITEKSALYRRLY